MFKRFYVIAENSQQDSDGLTPLMLEYQKGFDPWIQSWAIKVKQHVVESMTRTVLEISFDSPFTTSEKQKFFVRCEAWANKLSMKGVVNGFVVVTKDRPDYLDAVKVSEPVLESPPQTIDLGSFNIMTQGFVGGIHSNNNVVVSASTNSPGNAVVNGSANTSGPVKFRISKGQISLTP